MKKKSIEDRIVALEAAEYERSKDKIIEDQKRTILQMQEELMNLKRLNCELALKRG